MTRTASIERRMGPREWAILIFLSVIWGGSFFFNELSLATFQPLTLVAIRVAIGAFCLHLVALFMGWTIPREPKIWINLTVMSILINIIPFSCIAWGQTYLSGSLASILNATTPLFGVITAHFLTRDEPITLGSFNGVVIGFIGVSILIGGPDIINFKSGILPYIAVLSASLSYALAAVFGRRFASSVSAPVADTLEISNFNIVRIFLSISAIILIPLAAIFDRPWNISNYHLESLIAIFALGSLSTAFAFLLYFRVLAKSGATNILLVTLLVPASAIILGVTILNEVLLNRHLIGMGIIALALAIIDGRLMLHIRKYF